MQFDTQRRPQQIDPSVFIAPGATVLGDVVIGGEASVWFGSVIRGDCERIVIGSQTNVQDLCVLHADPGLPCVIGQHVTLGHAAIVHGATIEDDVMIGIRATVLNGASSGHGEHRGRRRGGDRRNANSPRLAGDGRARESEGSSDGRSCRAGFVMRPSITSRRRGRTWRRFHRSLGYSLLS